MNLSSFRIEAKAKAKMLFGTPRLFAENEEVHRLFHKKKTVAKFAKRSKKFAALVETINISVVYENEKNLKKLLVRTKL